MPELKSISGYNGCRRIRAYLEGRNKSRAIAMDFRSIAERSFPDGKMWSEVMDETRAALRNDVPPAGKRRAMMYKHYVISPDPGDDVALDDLRRLVCAWVDRFFGDYQVAVVYHDDNEGHIPHAHVVVNNTNLVDGHRLSSDLTNARVALQNNALQTMALDLGMHAFASDHTSRTSEDMASSGRNVSRGGGDPRWRDRSKVHGGEQAPRPRPRPAAKRRARRRTTEQHGARGMDSREGYVSWKTEIQERVDVARMVARDEREFTRALGLMGIEVNRSKSGDYLYHHPLGGKKLVSGKRLGPVYDRQSIRRGFELNYVNWLQRANKNPAVAARRRGLASLTDEQIERVARSIKATSSSRVAEGIRAADVAKLLSYNSEHGIKSLSSYGTGPEAESMRILAARLGLFSARSKEQSARTADDARLVGKWLQEDRSESGAGGGAYGEPSASSPDYEARRAAQARRAGDARQHDKGHE